MALFGRRKKKGPSEEPEDVVVPALPVPPDPSPTGLRALTDHVEYLLSLVEPLPPFGMQLLEAWDQTLCEDLMAMGAIPPVDIANVDGYAVRAADVESATPGSPAVLQMVDSGSDQLAGGMAVKVTAHTAMPNGTDAVIPEGFVVEEDEGRLSVLERVSPAENVATAGSLMAIGTPLMSSGDRLDARHIGLLAGAGIDKVFVRPRPRVVVLSSGEDILEPGKELGGSDQTWDANSYLIAAAARACGAQVWRVGIVGNDPLKLSEAVTDQLIRADLVISTTGSQRDYEQIKAVMADLALTDFTEVAMLPGKRQAFGLVGDDRVPMILLPGNPVSAYVSFQVFVRPMLRKLMGFEDFHHKSVRAMTGSVLRSAPGHVHLIRGRVRTEHGMRNVEAVHDSDPLRELANCNALIVIDEDTELVRAGESAVCWLLDDE